MTELVKTSVSVKESPVEIEGLHRRVENELRPVLSEVRLKLNEVIGLLNAALGTSLVLEGSLTIGSLNGVLRADAGLVSTDSDVTDLVTAATESAAGKVEFATANQVAAGTDGSLAVSAANVKYNRGVAKCVLVADVAGNLGNSSYNIESISDVGTGILDVTISTNFNTVEWACVLGIENIDASIDASTDVQIVMVAEGTKLGGSVRLIVGNASGTAAVDPVSYSMAGFGSQA